MTAKILDGWKLSQSILANLSHSQKAKPGTGQYPAKLAVIQVGNNPVSEKYIKEKEKAAHGLGFGFELHKFPKTIKGPVLESSIQKIANNPKNTGILIQLPLPPHLPLQEVLDCIPLKKDVDVLSSEALGLFVQGALPWMPPTVQAISLLLKESNITLKGTNVAVIGAGRLVGLPLSLWLMRQGSTLSILNKETKNLSFFIKKADVVISGVGKQGLVKGSMIKKGVVVIDAGTSVESGPSTPFDKAQGKSLRASRIKGDVDFESVSKKAKFISPVPGGVGPLTVACLFQNLTKLNNRDI